MEKQIEEIAEFVIKWIESQEEKKCFEPDKDGYIMFRRGGLSINLPVYLMMVLEDYLEEQALSKAEDKGDNGWISVEDRLPDNDDDYQVWEKGAIIATAAHYNTKQYYKDNYDDENYMEEGWYYSFKYPFDEAINTETPLTVTHWQQLPPKP